MAVSKPPTTSVENSEELSKVIHSVRAKSVLFMEQFEGRTSEIDKLEDEIIKEYINTDDILLGNMSDHIQVQQVLANSQRYLSRVTEIYAGAYRNSTKLKSVKNMFQNALLPLIQGGSADTRMAKVNDLTQGITYLLELEEGLISICETAMKNLKNAQDMASRTLKAIEMDLTFFNGSETLSKVVNKSRSKFYKFTEED